MFRLQTLRIFLLVLFVALLRPSVATAATATISLVPIADASVKGDTPANNYGTAVTMPVDADPIRLSYLMFDATALSGATVSRADLHIRVASDPSPGTQTIKPVPDTAWGERTITFNNKPLVENTVLGNINSNNMTESWQTVDITQTVAPNAGRKFSLAIDTTSTNGITFYSRESAQKPYITVEYGSVPTISPTPTPTPTAMPQTDPVLAVAGDISCDTSTSPTATGCYQSVTANLITQIQPTAVLPLGDTQYSAGQYQNYLTYYQPSWGLFKSISHPVVGNHEYGTSGASGYFDYFNGIGVNSGPAGDRGKGYYSYDLGSWHIIALNSECTRVSCTAGSAQEQWLRNDLASHPNACTMAYWHKQYFTSGTTGGNVDARPLVQALYDYNADLILGAHNHYYERFLPQNPLYQLDPSRGLVSITVGTGGDTLTGVGGSSYPNLAIRNGKTFGIAKVILHANSWDWQFIPAPGMAFTDSGSALCH